MQTLAMFLLIVSALVLGYSWYSLRGASTVVSRLAEIEDSEKDSYEQRPVDKQKKHREFKLNFTVSDRMKEEIRSSGLKVRVEEFLLIWATVVFAAGMLSLLLTRQLVISGIAVLGATVIPPLALRIAKARRIAKFGTQLYDVVMLLANSLRAGFSFEQALSSVASDMPDPIGTEFGIAVSEMHMGIPMEDALEAIYERTHNTDLHIMISAVMVQRRVGGNLSKILDNIANTIRERVRLRNKTAALTAQGRMSGMVVGVLPIGLYFIISAMNPTYMAAFFTSTLGLALLFLCIALEVIAFFVIRKIISI